MLKDDNNMTYDNISMAVEGIELEDDCKKNKHDKGKTSKPAKIEKTIVPCGYGFARPWSHGRGNTHRFRRNSRKN